VTISNLEKLEYVDHVLKERIEVEKRLTRNPDNYLPIETALVFVRDIKGELTSEEAK